MHPLRRSRAPATRLRAAALRPVEVQPHTFEADVSTGLELMARDELLARLKERISDLHIAPGAIMFNCTGDPGTLLTLRTVQAVFLVQTFMVARPKALLGDEHFRRLLAMIELVRDLFPGSAFTSLHINAAGSESSVMVRLRDELARRTSLTVGEQEGDLLLRIRPAPSRLPSAASGWQVLVRLSPRPLATRSWRVCNLEGALNAAVAQAMIRLTRPARHDAFLNLACGSGTLMVERLSAGRAARVIGVDREARVLACARENLEAAGFGRQADLVRADTRALPLPDACVDVLAADLPFGHLMGSHAENVAAYPSVLREAARVSRPGARFALITHEVRLMEQLLAEPACPWRAEQVLKVELGGLFPRIFTLWMPAPEGHAGYA